MIENVFIKLVTSSLLEEFLSGVAWENPLTHSVNESLGSRSKGLTLLNIQPSCFDWWNFGIAVFACAVAVVTCIFTIYMYVLLKQQVVDQLSQSLKNEENNKLSLEKSRKHVEEINIQILNNSLIKLIEKKHNINNNYDYLCDYLSEHSSLLKDGPVVMKEGSLAPIIIDIERNLGSVNEIMKVFDVWNNTLEDASKAISDSLDELKTEDVIASNFDETDKWLQRFSENETMLSHAIDNAVAQIKERIKHK